LRAPDREGEGEGNGRERKTTKRNQRLEYNPQLQNPSFQEKIVFMK